MVRRETRCGRDHGALVRWLAAMSGGPFTEAGGDNDCIAFAAGAVEAQTGRRLRLAGRGSVAAAARSLTRHGGMERAVTSRLGKPIAPALAQRGDIAGVPDPRFGLLLMVVEGQTLVGPGNRRAPRSAMAIAWSAEGRRGAQSTLPAAAA